MFAPEPNPQNRHWTVRAVVIVTGAIALIANLIAIIVFMSGKTSVQSLTSPSDSFPSSISNSQTSTHGVTYPLLKTNYAGTSYSDTEGTVDITLTVTSESQQGNFSLMKQEVGNATKVFCTGNVTVDNHITFNCRWSTGGGNYTSTGQGTIFPDGHMEMTVISGDRGEIWKVS